MKQPEHKTWTGGSTPDPRFVDVSPECQAYMIELYKEARLRDVLIRVQLIWELLSLDNLVLWSALRYQALKWSRDILDVEVDR